MSISDYIEARRREVEDALGRILPEPPDCPTVVHDAMRYSLLAGGKRLRPVLCLASADAKDDCLELFGELFTTKLDPDVDPSAEGHPLGAHLLDSGIDHPFFKLEVGDPVPEQTADTITALDDGNVVAHPGELLRSGKPGGA